MTSPLDLIAGALGAILFVEVALATGLLGRFPPLAANARKMARVIAAKQTSDHWKEKVLPAYAGRMFVGGILALALMALAFAVFLAPLLILGATGLSATPPVDLIESLSFNAAVLVVGAGYAWLRTRGGEKAAEEGAYGPLDRFLHRFALSSKAVRQVCFDIEAARVGKDALAAAETAPHVFVTGLARAGTSILLRTLYGTGAFATLTYRDMPFVLAPGLWAKLSAPFAKKGVEAERAHKDGLTVSFDSPEAFDEVFWLTFCDEDYVAPDRLKTHTPDDETITALRRYVAAIVASRPGGRYLSKNNNNLLRIGALRRAFPNACVVVPFRDPHEQAISLLRQHENFAAELADDPFGRSYMGWLGHFEFGPDEKPFAFANTPPPAGDNNDAVYWLERWLQAYDWVLNAHGDAVVFFDYDRFTAEPAASLQRLGERVGLDADWITLAGAIREQAKRGPVTDAAPALVQRCEDLYAELRRRAV